MAQRCSGCKAAEGDSKAAHRRGTRIENKVVSSILVPMCVCVHSSSFRLLSRGSKSSPRFPSGLFPRHLSDALASHCAAHNICAQRNLEQSPYNTPQYTDFMTWQHASSLSSIQTRVCECQGQSARRHDACCYDSRIIVTTTYRHSTSPHLIQFFHFINQIHFPIFVASRSQP